MNSIQARKALRVYEQFLPNELVQEYETVMEIFYCNAYYEGAKSFKEHIERKVR